MLPDRQDRHCREFPYVKICLLIGSNIEINHFQRKEIVAQIDWNREWNQWPRYIILSMHVIETFHFESMYLFVYWFLQMENVNQNIQFNSILIHPNSMLIQRKGRKKVNRNREKKKISIDRYRMHWHRARHRDFVILIVNKIYWWNKRATIKIDNNEK